MPEGHTLRRLANDLTAAFVGGGPVRVTSPQGRFAADAALLDGEPVLGADSAGKHLFVEFPGERFIHVHLGLIGRFDVRRAPVPAPVGQVRLRLYNDTAYADLRGATRCDLIGRDRHDIVIAALGPDPLLPDADPSTAWSRISRSPRPIGELLMDQTVLAGVGNVYRAEVLFRRRIHPLRPGRTLRVSQFTALWEDLVALMQDGVRIGHIRTVRPEHASGHGGPVERVYVYRRTGRPCLLCGTPIRTGELAGRNLFWCPRCQPTFRSRALVRGRDD